jgi:hypothetical protein
LLTDIRTYIAVALLVAGFGAGHWWVQTSWDKAEAARTSQQLAQEQELRRFEQARAAKTQEIQSDQALKQARLARAASDDHVAVLGLREQLDAIRNDAETNPAACRANAERVRVLAGLLAEGVGLVQEGKERVGRLDARLTGLQAIEGDVRVAAPPK